ncbi:leucine-rich repeat domain-containing protein [Parabacteroides sp. PF5-9]|uniref:leucine-rich repeat domain-containing protein n=1 Tax=Parabacteroides sp. PF5-9 TaxID=1742404 RepID=UPI00247361AC|nr:leucine-rich repeat domain-containing protein [Parabacteroides sp. PF5-9]MDH6358791.1 hypothetical protein [Parabacteroides sp. PF5-9]
MKRTVITMASLPLMKTFKNTLLVLFCVVLAGCNLIAEDEPDWDNPPPDTENNFRIYNGTLMGYNGHGGDITIPSGVVAIHMEVFENNKAITSVVIPEGVKIIGMYAFYNCTNLRSVSLPSTLQYIGSQSFTGCTALTSITIPTSVKEINYGAFENCTALNTVSVGWGMPLYSAEYAYDDIFDLSAMTGNIIPDDFRGTTYTYRFADADIFSNVDLSRATLKVPKGVSFRYENTLVWNKFGTIVEDANITIPADGITTKPQAHSAYDNQSGGIYKGVVAGTTGSFMIDLQGTKPQAMLFYDGMLTDLMKPWGDEIFESGQAIDLSFFAFCGENNGVSNTVYLTFSVEADGSNPQVRISDMKSEKMVTVVEKETSTMHIEVYEGTYSGVVNDYGTTNGMFNVLIKGDEIKGLSCSNQDFMPYTLIGTISGSDLSVTGTDGKEETPPLIITGTIASGTISGSYSQNLGEERMNNGTWSGRRLF